MPQPAYEYRYSIPEECEDSRYPFRSTWRGDDPSYREYIARDAAEHHNEYHDGWEASWPLVFRLETMEGAVLGDFSVDKEMVPHYSARAIKSTQLHSPAPEDAARAASETSGS